jgi:autotransporter-associated beta strand protein
MAGWSRWLRRWFGRRKGRSVRRRPLIVEGLEERLVPFSTCGGTWPHPGGLGAPVSVTYSYRNLFNGGIRGVSNYALLQAVEEALSLWARYAPITFREASSGQISIGHGPLSGSTVGLTSCPRGGNVTFDDSSRTWNVNLFLETAVHELGHALGLGHSTAVSAPADHTGPSRPPIMNPSIQGLYHGLGSAFLFQDDVNGIRARYGRGSGEVITTRAWTAARDGNWDTDASWTRGFEPTLYSDVTIERNRTVTISGGTRGARTITLGSTDNQAGTLNVTGGTLTVRKDISVGASGVGTLSISNATVNAAGLRFRGNAAADSEAVILNSGLLNLTAPLTDGTGSSSFTLNGGAFDLNNNPATVDRFTFNGGTLRDVGGSTLTVNSLLLLRNVTLSFGSVALRGGLTLDPAAAGPATVNGNLDLGGAPRTFSIADTNSAGGDLFVNGGISNGGLIKTGPGTLRLQGDNSYTGNTAINAGEVWVVSRIAGAATVAGGAALRGGGSVGAVVNNGIVRPGDAIGTLTVNGAYTQNGPGQLQIELGGPAAGADYDVLQVNGPATLGGVLNVNLVNGFTLTPGQTFDVVRADSIALNNLTLTGAAAGRLRFSLVTVGGDQVLRLTVADPLVRVSDNVPPDFRTAGLWNFLSGPGFGGSVATAPAGTGTSVATWTFSGLAAGTYRVSATWTAGADRATNASYAVLDDSTLLGLAAVNQRQAPNEFGADGAMWDDLGNFTLIGDTLVVRLTNAAHGTVVADAIRLERVD